jgi:type IV pilus assembly protein PilC
MPRFNYHAIELVTGHARQGVLDANNRETAVTVLKSRGMTPTKLIAESGLMPPKPAKADVGNRAHSRWYLRIGRVLSGAALAVFTRQLAMLVRVRMPLLRGLEVLGRQERNLAFRAVLEQMAAHIRSGGTLSESLRQHPRIFEPLYVNMVRAGEAGGALEVVLGRLAQFLEKSQQVRGRIKVAMTYPLIIVIVASVIVLGLMTFVVPKFEMIFAGTLKGQALPALTQFVLGVSELLLHHAITTLVLTVVLIGLMQVVVRTPTGARLLDRTKLRLPVIGELLRKAAIARFTRTFGTLLASGVPILQALATTGDTSGNVHLADAIRQVHDRVKEGEGVARPLRATDVFPDMVTSMIEVGEETGALPDMLSRIADTYDEEVDRSVDALTSLIEPLMIVLMAIMVGTIVIALFLPIMRIVQSLG